MPSPAVLAAWVEALSHIDGDFELRSAIDTQVAATPQPAVLGAALQAVGSIQGGFERREALNLLLDRPKLNANGLERVLTSAETMEGGFERLQVLLRVVERLGQAKPVDAALIDRLRRAGRGLGDHERGQIENALDRISWPDGTSLPPALLRCSAPFAGRTGAHLATTNLHGQRRTRGLHGCRGRTRA